MKYISRQQWGAKPPATRSGRFTSLRGGRVRGVVMHHSGVEGGPKGSSAVHAFEGHHLRKGWDGIAYNWLVDETGTIFEGRGWGARGAATKGWNAKSISVCFTGHGDTRPGLQTLRSLSNVVAEAQSRFGGGLWVSTHRRKGSTTCPGDWLGDWVEAGMAVTENPSSVDWAGIIAYFATLRKQVEGRPLGRWWPNTRRGEAVRLTQRRLRERGFSPGAADGVFGKRTADAVRAFQETQGFLKVNGVVNVNTFATLFVQ
jgi:hypothetical protein